MDQEKTEFSKIASEYKAKYGDTYYHKELKKHLKLTK